MPGTLDPRLRVISREPLNAETPLQEQYGVVTPTPLFYKRNHFRIPEIDVAAWRLQVGGEVDEPATWTYDELRSLPSRTLLATMECAGNGRSGFVPAISGEPWQLGAVSTAEWTGAPLTEVLEASGVTGRASEVLFEGADSGPNPEAGGTIPFVRSLRVEKALEPDVLLAYAMNGEALAPEHGFPVRLLVPGWYGMASVKWLARITASAQPFRGFYQVDRYVLAWNDREPEPLGSMLVRSLIREPASGVALPAGRHIVRGVAWSGRGAVARVEVSVDGGTSWDVAGFASDPTAYAWRTWDYRWDASERGARTLLSRAVDAQGDVQPLGAAWNRFGYCNNAVQPVHVTIV